MIIVTGGAYIYGIFNIGTVETRTWNDLIIAVFVAIGRKPDIEYIEMPTSIRDQYQCFTQADLSKLRRAGYIKSIILLEEAIRDYVQNYLEKDLCLTRA